jgi:hypothetical protein
MTKNPIVVAVLEASTLGWPIGSAALQVWHNAERYDFDRKIETPDGDTGAWVYRRDDKEVHILND